MIKRLLDNHVLLAIVGTTLGLALVVGAMGFKQLPFVASETDYTVQLEHAAGVKPKDDVRIAGISVGRVTDVKVDRGVVDVEVAVDENRRLGDETTASVEVATVLGKGFVQLTPTGDGELPAGATIPVSRTTVPYNLNTAFDTLGKTVKQTDVDTLGQSFQEITNALSDTSNADVQAVLSGVTGLSDAIATRRAEVEQLITSSATVAGTLADRSDSLIALMRYTNTFVAMLNSRRELLVDLLNRTRSLAAGVNELIRDNQDDLDPMLADLDRVSAVLARNSEQLEKSITNLGLFSTNIANATGTGPWLDLMLPTLTIGDNVIGSCGADPKPGCGRP